MLVLDISRICISFVTFWSKQDYNDESQELANQIALETKLGKDLVKGEI